MIEIIMACFFLLGVAALLSSLLLPGEYLMDIVLAFCIPFMLVFNLIRIAIQEKKDEAKTKRGKNTTTRD